MWGLLGMQTQQNGATALLSAIYGHADGMLMVRGNLLTISQDVIVARTGRSDRPQYKQERRLYATVE